MDSYRRYAIYYTPDPGSPLAAFGASWLGWDAGAGRPAAHPAIDLPVAAITGRPRKYGFHGTLKPPFRLAEGHTVQGLDAAAAALAASIPGFRIPPLGLATLGRFLALVPTGPAPALADLAARTVQTLDPFRAPSGEAELARRRATGLTAGQESMLTRWGYPYVMDEFRFHLTLTGPLDDPAPVASALAPLTAPHCLNPLEIHAISLVGEGKDGHFRVLRRYALGT